MVKSCFLLTRYSQSFWFSPGFCKQLLSCQQLKVWLFSSHFLFYVVHEFFFTSMAYIACCCTGSSRLKWKAFKENLRVSKFCQVVWFRIVIPDLQILVNLWISGVFLFYKGDFDSGGLLTEFRMVRAGTESKPSAAGVTELPSPVNPCTNQSPRRMLVALHSLAPTVFFCLRPLGLIAVPLFPRPPLPPRGLEQPGATEQVWNQSANVVQAELQEEEEKHF